MVAPQWKPIRAPQFSSAVISSSLSIVAAIMLAKMFWHVPGAHPWGVFFVSAILATMLVQLWRIHRVYQTAYAQAAAGNTAINKALSELNRTYMWGNGVFLVLACTVVIVYVSSR